MTKSNTTLSKRSVNKSESDARVCQGWDKGVGKCGAEAPYSITYTVAGAGISHTWRFCKRHHAKQQRKRFGTCSFRVRDENGKVVNCTSLRDTNTRGDGRKKKGYCRRHEAEYLKDMGNEKVEKVLDRLATIITPDSLTGCWITPARDSGGRSHISCGGRKWLTYRLTFAAFFGSHNKGEELAHSCDRSLCCNPLHVIPMRKKVHQRFTNDRELTNLWAAAQAAREAPEALVKFAEAHSLPLYGDVALFLHHALGADDLKSDPRLAFAA